MKKFIFIVFIPALSGVLSAHFGVSVVDATGC